MKVLPNHHRCFRRRLHSKLFFAVIVLLFLHQVPFHHVSAESTIITTSKAHTKNDLPNNEGETTCSTLEASQGKCQGSSSLPVKSTGRTVWEAIQSKLQGLFQSASATVPSYYLIWSPGATKKIILSSLWLAVFHVYRDFLQGISQTLFYNGASIFWGSQSEPPRQIVTSIILPLLSSACCAIQLVLNIMGVGCAGFNSYLGPFRSYFLTLLMYLSLVVYPPTTFSAWVGLVARSGIALLPELVHLWNTYYNTTLSTSKDSSSLLSQSRMVLQDSASSPSPPPPPPEGTIQATVELIVPTMGCVACINKINASLRQSSPQHFLEGASWLVPPPHKGGRASVTLVASDEDELQAVIQKVQDTIHAAGFENTQVDSIQRRQDCQQQQQQLLLQQQCSTGKQGTVENNNHNNDGDATDETVICSSNTGTALSGDIATQVEWSIPTMSCEGCIAEINTAARQASPKVIEVSSWLLQDQNEVGGKASLTVLVSSKQELDHVLKEVQNSWMAAGFYDIKLDSMEFVAKTVTTTTTSLQPTAITATVTWNVPTMSCDGCIRTIDAAVKEASPQHVLSISSQLDSSGGGSTTVVIQVKSLKELNAVVAFLERSIQDQGFEDLQVDHLHWVAVQETTDH